MMKIVIMRVSFINEAEVTPSIEVHMRKYWDVLVKNDVEFCPC